jgi:hypothetical protein
MTEPEIIDLIDPLQFDAPKWIRSGRKYPENPKEVPWELLSYCGRLQEIPANITKEFFPDDSMRVDAFLILKLPKESFSLVHIKPDRCFSNLTANRNPTCLAT